MDRFRELGGHFVRGRGRITGRGEVTVDTVGGTRVLRARCGIVVNTGTQPTIPPVPGLAGTPYWTNREAVETRPVTRPDSVRKLTRHVQCPGSRDPMVPGSMLCAMVNAHGTHTHL